MCFLNSGSFGGSSKKILNYEKPQDTPKFCSIPVRRLDKSEDKKEGSEPFDSVESEESINKIYD
jgi:hypothetical protein